MLKNIVLVLSAAFFLASAVPVLAEPTDNSMNMQKKEDMYKEKRDKMETMHKQKMDLMKKQCQEKMDLQERQFKEKMDLMDRKHQERTKNM